ncbi:PIN domain-containing protein [Bacillus sp. S74]|uniref:PIN-like domain-containing protein n=1 Tax=Bacillus sp. S74 TaxID=1317225 RepID=UPI00190C7D65|nr:PIN domain-containing protein [Bacillus sp. S74]MBK0149797.1 DUF4935 domain-containing protein [Bacillus sp. S74]
MKAEFPEFQGYNNDQFKELFKECIFVFDTNVLLNLYKYSIETKKEWLEILHRIEDRLWMPDQVGLEYNFNRLSVISDQENFYNGLISSLESGSKEFINELAKKYDKIHPHIKWDNIKAQLEGCITNLTEDIKVKQQEHPNLFADDEVLTEINKLFKDKVGNAYSQDQLDKIYEEGKKRYDRKCPPGYKDLAEKKGQVKQYGGNIYKDEYGDLVVWYQIIEYAKNNEKPIVFITDDRKEDWWGKQSGKTVGPRIELLNEFSLKAGTSFYMYRAARFLEEIRVHLHESVNNKAIEEVKELNLQNEIENEKCIRDQVIYKSYNSILAEYNKKILEFSKHNPEQKIKGLIREIESLTTEVTEYYASNKIHLILNQENDDYERIKMLKELKNMIILLEKNARDENN